MKLRLLHAAPPEGDDDVTIAAIVVRALIDELAARTPEAAPIALLRELAIAAGSLARACSCAVARRKGAR